MIEGMEAAQRAYDRQEPREDEEETRVHSSSLGDCDIGALTDKFIAELANADHNRIEELLGNSPSDLEMIYPVLAQKYKFYEVEIDSNTNGFFWNQCKKMALNAYDQGYLDL